jgi:hypothetical protein
MHKKMERLLAANGLNATRSKILNSITSKGKTTLIIECDDVIYEVQGLNKKIIKKEDKLLEDYKIQNVDIVNDIIIIDGKSTDKTIDEYVADKKVYEVTKTDTQKPRGWHFRPVFVDENGEVYFKGKLQPELKGKYDEEGNLI